MGLFFRQSGGIAVNGEHQNDSKHSDFRGKLRRKGLKLLAYCERARVSFSRHPVSPLLYVVILALAIGAVTFNGMYSRAYVLTVDGEELGMVSSESDVQTLVAHVESRAASVLGETYSYDADIELTPAITSADGFGDMEEMEDTMFANAGALMEVCAISVDGEELGYAPTEEAMREMLERVAEPYFSEYTTGFDFVQDVQLYTVEVPSNTEFDLESIYEVLTACTVEEAFYTVQKGDTFNHIAYALDMTPADLSALNPDININKIQIGQQLRIQESVPYLSVYTYENKTYEAVIHSPVEEIPTADLYVGNSKVKEQGEDGLAMENADITYVNGVEVERVIRSSETIVPATTTYTYVGTTPRPKTASNGYYLWPTTTHRITSPYGYRYIFGSYSFHLGVDIGASYGTAIKASDGGKVTYSGWKGSYGKLVVITHDDGSQTYYAHCSSLLVSSGERVYQGQTIAKVGSTGNSTGPHLHFEIRINGKTVDPLTYLP